MELDQERKRKLLIVGVMVFIILVVILLLYFVLKKKQKKEIKGLGEINTELVVANNKSLQFSKLKAYEDKLQDSLNKVKIKNSIDLDFADAKELANKDSLNKTKIMDIGQLREKQKLKEQQEVLNKKLALLNELESETKTKEFTIEKIKSNPIKKYVRRKNKVDIKRNQIQSNTKDVLSDEPIRDEPNMETINNKPTKDSNLGEKEYKSGVIQGTQTLKNGSRVKIRLTSFIKHNNIELPINTFIYGFVSFSNRVIITVNRINFKGKSVQFPLEIYDTTDGELGLYSEELLKSQITNQIKDKAISSGTDAVKNQTNNVLAGAINTSSSILRTENRQKKITLPDQTRILIRWKD